MEKEIIAAAWTAAQEAAAQPEMPWLLQTISDYRIIVMPALLLVSLWMLAKTLKSMWGRP